MISTKDFILLILFSIISARQNATAPWMGIVGACMISSTYSYQKGLQIAEYWQNKQERKQLEHRRLERVDRWYQGYQATQHRVLQEQQNMLQQEQVRQQQVQGDLRSVLGYSLTGFMAHGLHGYYERIKHMDQVKYPTMSQRIKNLNFETFSMWHPIQSLKGNKSCLVPIIGPILSANLAAMTYLGLTDCTYETWKHKRKE